MERRANTFLWCAGSVIAILIVVKLLGLNPSEISTVTVSVKFHGIAPALAVQAQANNSAELEAKIRELQAEMRITPPKGPTNSAQAPQFVNAGGLWKSSVFNIQLVQSGNQLVMAVYLFGTPTAAGGGFIHGRELLIDYVNSAMLSGRMQGTISADGSRLDIIDSATGQSSVLIR